MSDDLEAMRLFVADGNKAVQWHAIDEIERSHYRKLATQENSSVVKSADELDNNNGSWAASK